MTTRKQIDELSIPFAGSWGLRPRSNAVTEPQPQLSIPFAGSWGLRHLHGPLSEDAFRFFQSRLPGVGGSAVVGTSA